MKKLTESRGIKSPIWQSAEILRNDDINEVSKSLYQLVTDMFVMLSQEQAGTTARVLGGLRVTPKTGLTLTLEAGGAVSFDGEYREDKTYNFEFVPESGAPFAVVLQQDEDVPLNAADSTNPRIDVIQVRPVRITYDPETRKFRDPLTGSTSPAVIPTNTSYQTEIQVVEGTPASSPSAPASTAGWIKIAEVIVPAGASSISDANIVDYRASAMWTNDTGATKAVKIEAENLTRDTLSGLTNGLVHHWSFNDHQMWKAWDSAGGVGRNAPIPVELYPMEQGFYPLKYDAVHYHPVFTRDPSTASDGVTFTGNEASFNGTSGEITLPNSNFFDGWTDVFDPIYDGWSIAARVKINTANPAGGNVRVFEGWDTTGYIAVFWNDTTNAWRCEYSDGTLTLAVESTPAATTDWYDLFITWNGITDIFSFYVNGQLVGTDTGTLGAFTPNNFKIGVGQAGTEFFDGLIKDFRIFTVTVPATRIASYTKYPETDLHYVDGGVNGTAIETTNNLDRSFDFDRDISFDGPFTVSFSVVRYNTDAQHGLIRSSQTAIYAADGQPDVWVVVANSPQHTIQGALPTNERRRLALKRDTNDICYFSIDGSPWATIFNGQPQSGTVIWESITGPIPNRVLDGLMDEVMMWDRDLSDAEILTDAMFPGFGFQTPSARNIPLDDSSERFTSDNVEGALIALRQNKLKDTQILNGVDITEGQVFSALDSYIPTVGDRMKLSGNGRADGSDPINSEPWQASLSFTDIERTSATAVTLYYGQFLLYDPSGPGDNTGTYIYADLSTYSCTQGSSAPLFGSNKLRITW